MTRLVAAVLIVQAALLVRFPVASQDRCDILAEKCDDDAAAAYDRCTDSCSALSSDSAFERCFDRCDAADERAYQMCDVQFDQCLDDLDRVSEEEDVDPTAEAGELFGSRESGEDGCYFGECPDGTRPGGTPPQTQPDPGPRQSPVPQPPQQQPFPQVPQQQFTAICQTPTFWCRMYQMGPVGYSCYCNSAFGPVGGLTVPQ